MRYSPIPSKLFIDRRKSFAKKMVPGSAAVFFSNDPMPRSADQLFPFRQNSALFSLSGIDQPGTILLIYPKSKRKSHKEIVFLMPKDPKHAIWNGDRLSKKEASKISGIESILTIDKWERIKQDMLGNVETIYVNLPIKQESHSEGFIQNPGKAFEFKKSHSSHHILSAATILKDSSMIKHSIEIDLLKHAVHVTGLGFKRLLHTVKPGMKEFEVEAELTYVLTRHGCQHAFEPIVASGKSACTLHYITNDRTIKADSLILLDFGAEYANMASDMSRTIPASGKFSREQKKIYSAVLRILHQVTEMIQPGNTFIDLNKEAGKLIESELIGLKVISRSAVKKQDAKSPLWKKYFMHGVSHHLGYDVHDLSDRDAPFREGMVLTCEPGLYLPELKMGIRLENDILITRKGPQNLMASIPIDPDEIETIMQSRT